MAANSPFPQSRHSAKLLAPHRRAHCAHLWFAAGLRRGFPAALFVGDHIVVARRRAQACGCRREFLPTEFHLENYPRIFEMIPFARFFGNSMIVTSTGRVWRIALGIVGGLWLCAHAFPWPQRLCLCCCSTTMMIPYPVTMIPSFILWVRGLGMANTFGPLMLPPFFGPAFSIFLLRQFFMTINKSWMRRPRLMVRASFASTGRLFCRSPSRRWRRSPSFRLSPTGTTF